MTAMPPISNVRSLTMLFADAPSSFSEMAMEAELLFIEEATEVGTRYVIDFASLPSARQDHPMVRQLAAIATNPANDRFWQICLEPK